jgi:uncharacterized protein with beta-barrel porin domain
MNIKYHLNKLLKKVTSVISIFAIITASSVGFSNSANADDGDTLTIADDATVTNATLHEAEGNAITTGDMDIVVDGVAVIDIAADTDDFSFDTITTLAGAADNVDGGVATLLLNLGGITVTNDLTITNNAGDPLTITIAESSTLIATLLASGADANELKFIIEAGSTLQTGANGTYSANIDGAGTLKIAGATATFDEAIGSSVQLGILDIDNTAVFSSTVSAAAIDVITDKVATFSGDVTATTITVNGTGNAKFVGNVTASNINLTGGGVVTINNIATKTITANISEATAGATSLVIADTADDAHALATFSGNITVDTIAIGSTTKAGLAKFSGSTTGAVTVTGGNDAVEDSMMEVASNTQTGAVALEEDGAGDATFKLSGTTSEIVGAITTTGDGEGQVVAATTVMGTFDAIGTDVLKVQTVSVDTGSIATFGGAVAADTLTITGTATFQAAANESEVIVIADGANVILNDTITNGMQVFNEVATTAPSIHEDAKIYMPINLTDGQTLVMFVGEGDATIGDAVGNDTELDATMQSTALMTYDAALIPTAVSANGATVVTATATTESARATSLGVSSNMAKAVSQAYLASINDTVADATAEDSFFNAFNALGGMTATTDTDLTKQVSVQDDLVTGSTFATKAMTGTVQGIVASRMASLRSGDAYVSGVAAGNGMNANSMFLQAFGSMSEQDNKTVGSGTQFGYEADTAGLAIGADGLLSNGSVLGLSLSTSNTDVDGKGTGRARNDIDSYTASLYMDKATAAGYIEGSLTYGINENSSSRIIDTAGLNRTYSADYDSDQISLKIGGGIPNDIGDNTFITPFASLTATKISTDAYTEKSTTADDSLRLRVAQADVDSYVGTIGIKAHKVTDQGTPMISLAINNEFGDSTISSTNTYQGGGTAFNTSTDVEELSATLALGYKFGSDKLSFTLGYEATANDDDYLSHYGTAKLVSKF